MKKGISQLVLPRGKSLKEHLEFARSAGYEGIELSFRIEELHLDMKESELEAVREMCLEHGLIPCSACGVSAPLTSPDRDEREKGKENVIKLLRCAKALGIDAVLVVPGRVTESVPYDAAYENCLRSLMELAPVAEEIKVSIAIESGREHRISLHECPNRQRGVGGSGASVHRFSVEVLILHCVNVDVGQ